MAILNTYSNLVTWVGDYELVGIDNNEAATADKTKNMTAAYLRGINLRPGEMFNGKISPTVSANDLILALKTYAGTDPSAADPVFINIGGTVRVITAALSVTAADGTNWAGLGGAQFATLENDLFPYLGYNATDGVVIGWSRIPNANLYSDFSATSTNEKYCKISTITNAAAGDNYVNIGRFAATLSAGAGYTWTVPTFTTANLIQRPTFETRVTAYTPSETGFSSTTVNLGRYKIKNDLIWASNVINGTSDGTDLTHGAPFTAKTITGMEWHGSPGIPTDGGTPTTTGDALIFSAAAVFTLRKSAAAAWTNSGNKAVAYQIEYEY